VKWIDKTPAGRLGFSNYKELLRFCERYGIEVPAVGRRSWQRGITVQQRDWARLEKEQGDRIRQLLALEKKDFVPVTAIAGLFGIRGEYAISVLRGGVELIKRGRNYVVKRVAVPAAINRIRERLERTYVRRRTRERKAE